MINFSTRNLMAFKVLAETKHFTRAASMLHMSQSALSAIIQKLEQELACKLFTRTTRQIELTKEGNLFYSVALNCLAQQQNLLENFFKITTGIAGRVRIAVLPSIASDWLPEVFEQYHQEFPDVEIDIYDCLSNECVSLLKSGQVDFALASLRQIDPEIEVMNLFADEYYVICHKSHPLATKKFIKLQEISHYALIALSNETSVSQFIEQSEGIVLNKSKYIVRNITTASSLVAKNFGICLLPGVALALINSQDIRAIPLTEPRISRRIQLLTKSSSNELPIHAKNLLKNIQMYLTKK
jgi:DNA-binding transcriptional LysR family regulator